MEFTDLCEASSDRTGLLRAEVERQILLVLVELPEVLLMLLVHERQDPGNRLADSVAEGTIVVRMRCGQQKRGHTFW